MPYLKKSSDNSFNLVRLLLLMLGMSTLTSVFMRFNNDGSISNEVSTDCLETSPEFLTIHTTLNIVSCIVSLSTRQHITAAGFLSSLLLSLDANYANATPLNELEDQSPILLKAATDLSSLEADGLAPWITVMGASGDASVSSVIEASDGSYVIIGSAEDLIMYDYSYGAYGIDNILVAKITQDGLVEWAKTFGGSSNDFGYSLIETNEGSYVFMGHTYSYSDSGSILVAKLTQDGILSWAKTIDDVYAGRQSLIAAKDGGYFLAGYTFSNSDVWLIKLAQNGEISWAKTFGGAGDDRAYSLIAENDGSCVLAGYTTSFDVNKNNDVLVLKLTFEGEMSWAKTYGGGGDDSGSSLIVASDGGYLLTGYTRSFDTQQNTFVVKLTHEGKVNWARTFDGSISSLIEASDGSYVLIGSYLHSRGARADDRDILLAKLSQNGELQWLKTFGASGYDSAYSLIESSDGSYLLAGLSNYYRAVVRDALVMKLDSDGNGIVLPDMRFEGSTSNFTISNISLIAVARSLETNTISMNSQTITDNIIESGIDLEILSTNIDTSSAQPSSRPTVQPSNISLEKPSALPLAQPSSQSSKLPSAIPSGQPLSKPSNVPIAFPSLFPSLQPVSSTIQPTQCPTVSYAGPWTTVMGGYSYSEGQSIIEASDGGYMLIGSVASSIADNHNMLIVKLTQWGEVSWSKTLDFSSGDYGKSIIRVRGGGYIIMGNTYNPETRDYDVLVAKLSQEGAVIWAKTFGGSYYDYERAYSLIEVNDGGYLLLCDTYDRYGAGGYDVLVVKLTQEGIVSWARSFGGTRNDHCYSLIEASDGSYVLIGATYSFGVGNYDVLVIKLMQSGVIAWMRTIGGINSEYGYSLIEASDGSYILVGDTLSYGEGIYDVLVMKLTKDGEVTWAKTFGGGAYDKAYSLIEASDGSYVIIGYTNSYGVGIYDFLVMKLTQDGEIKWVKTFGGSDFDIGRSLIEASDRSYVLTGYTFNYDVGDDVNVTPVIKLDGDGNGVVLPGLHIEDHTSDVKATNISLTSVAQLLETNNIPIITQTITENILESNIDLKILSTSVDAPSSQPSSQPVAQPSTQPSSMPSRQPLSLPSRLPSTQPSRRPTSQPSSQPAAAPTRQPSDQPSTKPSSQPSSQPVAQPSTQSSGMPSQQPSSLPSRLPSTQPSSRSTSQPSSQPIAVSTGQPSGQPSIKPSSQPSSQPTLQPSIKPSAQASSMPSRQPLSLPSRLPSTQPSRRPISQPSCQPIAAPTRQPSGQPSIKPSNEPFGKPSFLPVAKPSSQPSGLPSAIPSNQPLSKPSNRPASSPSAFPSLQPTSIPFSQVTQSPIGYYMNTWNIVFGPGRGGSHKSLLETSDGSYVLIGSTESYGAGSSDVLVVKLTQNGEVNWSRTLGGSNDEWSYSLIEVSDGNYVITGSSNSYGTELYLDVLIVKLNQNGLVSWAKTLGGGRYDLGYSIIEASDGGYLLNGFTSSDDAGTDHALLVKLTQDGDIGWAKSIVKTFSGDSLIEASDGSYVLVGYISQSVAEEDKIFVVKLTEWGDISWTKTIGGSGYDSANSLVEASDVSYVITGFTESYGAGDADVLVVKLTQYGEMIWAKTIGGERRDFAQSILEVRDGSYVLTGSTESYGAGDADVLVVKLTQNGKMIWAKTIGGERRDYANSIIEVSDGGYLLNGQTESYGTGSTDVLIVKLDSNGNALTLPGITIEDHTSDFTTTNIFIASEERSLLTSPLLLIGQTITESIVNTEINLEIFRTTNMPTIVPTSRPTNRPSSVPTQPTNLPSSRPTNKPSSVPTQPTSLPSSSPSSHPSSSPSMFISTWTTVLSGRHDEYGNSIVQANDGSYALIGYTYSRSNWARVTDVLMVKLAQSGAVLWVKTIGGNPFDGGSGYDIGYSLIEDKNGSYVLGGITLSYGAGASDVLVVKLDADGVVSWAKAFGTDGYEYAYSLIKTRDGGYALTGRTQSSITGDGDVLVAKLNQHGEFSWAKTLGGGQDDSGFSLIEVSDGYVLTGYTESYGAGGKDVLVTKLSQDGGVAWVKTLGGSADDFTRSITEVNNGYVLTGYTESYGSGAKDVLVIKLTQDGEVSWARAMGDSNEDAGYSIIESRNGYLLTGYTEGGADKYGRVLVAKLSEDGIISWTKMISGNNYNSGHSLIKTDDGGYALTGFTEQLDTGGSKGILVVKLDDQGNGVVLPDMSIENSDSSFTVTNIFMQTVTQSIVTSAILLSTEIVTNNILIEDFALEIQSTISNEQDDDHEEKSSASNSSEDFSLFHPGLIAVYSVAGVLVLCCAATGVFFCLSKSSICQSVAKQKKDVAIPKVIQSEQGNELNNELWLGEEEFDIEQGQNVEGQNNATDVFPPFIDETVIHLEQALGEGKFGNVYRAKWTSRKVAIKKYKEDGAKMTKEAIIKMINHEASLMKFAVHPAIIKFYSLAGTNINYPSILVMEYAAAGSVDDYLKDPINKTPYCFKLAIANRLAKKGPNKSVDYYLQHQNEMSWLLRLRIACEVTSAVAFLHSEEINIVHRDIKGGNIVLDEAYHAKLCDFGIALQLPTNESSFRAGTLRWMAPELFDKSTAQPHPAADVWSLAMFFIQLLKCSFPFQDDKGDDEQIKSWICEGFGHRMPTECEDENLPELAEIMRCCWQDRFSRPKASELEPKLLSLYQRYEHDALLAPQL